MNFYKGDQRINDDMGRCVITRMGRRYRIFIPEVNESDTGSYTIEVKDESAIVKKQFKINVEGECCCFFIKLTSFSTCVSHFITYILSLD